MCRDFKVNIIFINEYQTGKYYYLLVNMNIFQQKKSKYEKFTIYSWISNR